MRGKLIQSSADLYLAILLAGLASTAVHGQVIEEITVTTRKAAEDLQDVPIAITAVGTAEIERLGIKSLQQLVQLDTSVRVQDSNFSGGGAAITMRGLAPDAGHPNVATLIDGIDVTSEGLSLDGGSMLIDPRLIDVERIEIVKGPQNALYGRNAFAGAIQYVTKNPTETFYADIGVDIAEDGYETLRGTLSGPIGDTLGYRINALWYDEDGFYRNSMTGAKIGGAEGKGVALTLKWDPSDALSFKWRTEYSDDDFAIPAQAALPLNTDLVVGALASECMITPAGFPGPVADRNCDKDFAAQVASDYFDNPDTGTQILGLGDYDPDLDPGENPFRNQFNDMVWPTYTGKIPDVGALKALTGHKDGIAISPNYQYGPGADDPTKAKDYHGNERDVLRSTLIVEWDMSDNWSMTSWTSWADADMFTAQDGDKVAIPMLLDPMDPTSLVDDTSTTLNIYQDVETELFSQEIRFAVDFGDVADFTFGALYWNEKAEQFDRSSPIILAGPQCYVFFDNVSDAALHPNADFFSLNALQHECGRTEAPARDWAAETFEANPGYLSSRETEHVSLYASLNYRFTEQWEIRAEARRSNEDTETAGPRMTPCWEGLSRGEAEEAGCLEPYDVIIGPGTVVLCGQTGRCDTGDQSSTVPGYEGNDWGWWANNFAPVSARTDTFKASQIWTAPKLTLTYQPTDAMTFYGSWAVAEKPGGFSLLTSGTFGVDPNLDGVPDEIAFEPEEMIVWEIGGKTAWQDRRLLVNGALFFQDFTDKQVRISEVIGGVSGPVIRNVAGAEIWGLEMDANWAVTERLTLAGAFTWLDTEYADYTTVANNPNEISALGCIELTEIRDKVTDEPAAGACKVSRNGNELERAPRLAGTTVINYTAPLAETGMDWYVQWRTVYEDEQFVNAENNVILQSRRVTDLRFGVQADRWDAQFYINNLFDNDTIPSAGQSGPDLPNSEFRIGMRTTIPPNVRANPKIPRLTFANLPPPRQAGVQFQYRFGN